MQGLYRAILKLYPAEDQATFAPEMIDVFHQAGTRLRGQGLCGLVLFGLRELTGSARGLILEHTAKRMAPETYITSRSLSRQDRGLPEEIVEARTRLEQLLRSMESAIATHDFVKARFYSNEECIARELLQDLLNEHKLSGLCEVSSKLGSA